MASDAQIRANRLNAQKSTGPRTAAGKAVVAQNAVRHGLLAEQGVIRGEDPGEFEFYREQMLEELAPAGAMESMLAERAVGLAWRLRRAERIQAEVFNALLAKETTDPVRKLLRSMESRGAEASQGCPDEGDLTLGRVAMRDFGNARVLDRLGMYERRIENSLYKTLGELQKLRLLGELNSPATEPSPEPVRPPRENTLCETKPICPTGPTAAESPNPAPRAHNRRSGLTMGAPLGMIPDSEGGDSPRTGRRGTPIRIAASPERNYFDGLHEPRKAWSGP